MTEFVKSEAGEGEVGVTRAKYFGRHEILKIEAEDLRGGFGELGRRVGKDAKLYLRKLRQDMNGSEYSAALADANESLKLMGNIKNEGIFKIRGVNRLARYMDAFEGYCVGCGITLAEGAFLQMEGEGGCQSLIVQNKDTGEVAMVHTEEDENWLTLFNYEKYLYRWVEMQVGQGRFGFLMYPGLSGWGYSLGVNYGSNMIQLADTLNLLGSDREEKLWANAMAFMTLDVGEAADVKAIVGAASSRGLGYVGGYALHMIFGNGRPVVGSLEFGGDVAEFSEPKNVGDRLVLAQGNYSRSGEARKVDELNQSGGRVWERLARARDRKMMQRIQRRLELLGSMIGRGSGVGNSWGRDRVMEIGLKVLADPYGDWRRFNVGGYVASLPNELVVAHGVGYVSGEGEVSLYIGKGVPEPLEGRPFSLKKSRFTVLDINEQLPSSAKPPS